MSLMDLRQLTSAACACRAGVPKGWARRRVRQRGRASAPP